MTTSRLRWWLEILAVAAALPVTATALAHLCIRIATATDPLPWGLYIMVGAIITAFWSGLIGWRAQHGAAALLFIVSCIIAVPFIFLWALMNFGS